MRALSRGFDDSVEVGGDRALAVGAGDVHNGGHLCSGCPSFASSRSTRPSDRSISCGCRSFISASSASLCGRVVEIVMAPRTTLSKPFEAIRVRAAHLSGSPARYLLVATCRPCPARIAGCSAPPRARRRRPISRAAVSIALPSTEPPFRYALPLIFPMSFVVVPRRRSSVCGRCAPASRAACGDARPCRSCRAPADIRRAGSPPAAARGWSAG